MATRRGNGEASIDVLPSGSYRGRVMIGGRRHTVTGETKQAVRRKLRDLQHNADRGIVPSRSRHTLATFAELWLRDVVKHSVRVRTHESYSSLLRLYAIPSLGATRLTALQPAHLQRLYSDLLTGGRLVDGVRSGRALAPKIVRNVHLCIHSALEQAVKWDLVPRNVADLVDPPDVARRELAVFDREQARLLLESCKGSRMEALVSVAAGTGMRQSELLGLRWRDVDLKAGTLVVSVQYGRDRRLAEPKTDRSRRKLDLPASAISALQAHKMSQLEDRLLYGRPDPDLGLVFTSRAGKPLEHRNVSRDYRALVRRAGLPPVPFHGLRHTHATLLLASGAPVGDVSARLGHGSAVMTLDVYGHVLPDAGRGLAARMEALLA